MLLMANPWKEQFESTSIQFFLFDFNNLHVYQQNSLENILLPCETFAKITDPVNSLKQDSLERKLVPLSQIDSYN